MSDETNDTIESIYARRVLVPIANPTTAWNLLRLGALLAEPEEGEIIALNVVISDTSDDRFDSSQAALEELVEKLSLAGMPVRWVSVTATSPARGILDSAREENADLIVLGFFGSDTGPVLGSVVEAVARTAPSDLVVYKGATDADLERILLPANGSRNAQVAARLGMMLSEAYHLPVTALYVQAGYSTSRWLGLGHIAATFNNVSGVENVEKKIIYASDAASGVLKEAGPQDLVVLGFSERTQFEHWLYGNVPQRVLREAQGPVILTKDARSIQQPIRERARDWVLGISPRLTPVEQVELRQRAYDMARPNINYFVLVILSCIIASFGLIQNSAAVIIGAMLVAPLMSPLLGFSAGLVIGELRTMQMGASAVTRGFLLAFLIAAGVGLISPVTITTPEMAIRTQPTLLDMGIALASGTAAAYATARRDVPAALAGVAIAAALMPPICTVGLAAAFDNWPAAGGSFALFITNIASIALSGALTFRWLGVKPSSDKEQGQPMRQRIAVLSLFVLLLALPLTVVLYQLSTQANQTQTVQSILEKTWRDIPGVEMVDFETDYTATNELRVVCTVRAIKSPKPAQVQALQDLLNERLRRKVTLDVVVLRVMHPPTATPTLTPTVTPTATRIPATLNN